MAALAHLIKSLRGLTDNDVAPCKASPLGEPVMHVLALRCEGLIPDP